MADAALASLHDAWVRNPQHVERLCLLLGKDRAPEYGAITITFHNGDIALVEANVRYR